MKGGVSAVTRSIGRQSVRSEHRDAFGGAGIAIGKHDHCNPAIQEVLQRTAHSRRAATMPDETPGVRHRPAEIESSELPVSSFHAAVDQLLSVSLRNSRWEVRPSTNRLKSPTVA